MRAAPLVSRGRIEGRFVLLLSVVVVAVTALSYVLLYRLTLVQRQAQLQEMVRSQARIMEATAKFDAFFQSGDVPGAARSATLSQIKESHRQYTGFGETGEIVLAERVGDQIVFLLPTRKLDFRTPAPVAYDATRAGPMRLALGGGSGVITAPDFTGVAVLAAYEYLPFLDMGLVAKVDLTEIRSPFVRSALLALGLAAVLIAVAAFANWRTISPLLSQVYDSAEQIAEREQRYRDLVANIPGVVYRAELADRHRFHYVSEAIRSITGHPPESFLKDGTASYEELVHPEDAEILRRAGVDDMEEGKAYSLEYRVAHADGGTRWVHDQGSVTRRRAPHDLLLDGVIIDITDRKKAETTLAELPRKLSRYLSPQVYRSIFEGSQDVKVGSARKKLTVFLSDIVGFTAQSENLDPEDLSYVINSYLNRMANIAVEHGGTLDKFVGDGVVIFFGDPETRGVSADAQACVSMALDMRESIADLNRDILAHGIDAPIQVRMGITTGFCTVGNFGSENRMDYTILGRTVNLASRLETTAETDEIQIGHETYLLVRDDFECQEKEPLTPKGLDYPIQVYRVTGRKT